MPRRKKVDPISHLETELALLYEISTLVQLSPSNRETFEKILELIGKVIDFRSASMFLLSMDDGQLTEVAKIGRSVNLIDFVKFELGMGLSAWVAKEKRPIMLNNLRKENNDSNFRSFMSVPMIFKDELIGVLNFANDQTDAFTKRDMQIVGVISAEIAVTIERQIYENRLQQKHKQIVELNNELDELKHHMVEIKKKQGVAEMAATLNQEISNPLAIIAGNAQFLLMTMKSSNPSIVKRLKAIDKEASTITQIMEKFRRLDSGRSENLRKPGTGDYASLQS